MTKGRVFPFLLVLLFGIIIALVLYTRAINAEVVQRFDKERRALVGDVAEVLESVKLAAAERQELRITIEDLREQVAVLSAQIVELGGTPPRPPAPSGGEEQRPEGEQQRSVPPAPAPRIIAPSAITTTTIPQRNGTSYGEGSNGIRVHLPAVCVVLPAVC